MKKYKKTIIVAIVSWIPLGIVLFNHSTEESMLKRIALSVASGPILFFTAGITALAIAALITCSFSVVRHLEAFNVEEDMSWAPVLEHSFTGIYGVAFAVLYYLTITNQHIFFKLYGGW
jgi:hypothetical protein